eukprot:GHVU01160411.1.p1 GENE.GHVU01160411.1~~GHVU01160411.1.p1  ORF type:complete len:303 (+),score=36.36 GHVU01160411.1:83-991(+)
MSGGKTIYAATAAQTNADCVVGSRFKYRQPAPSEAGGATRQPSYSLSRLGSTPQHAQGAENGVGTSSATLSRFRSNTGLSRQGSATLSRLGSQPTTGLGSSTCRWRSYVYRDKMKEKAAEEWMDKPRRAYGGRMTPYVAHPPIHTMAFEDRNRGYTCLMGPVIGGVTHSTARILFVFDKALTVTCALTPQKPSTFSGAAADDFEEDPESLCITLDFEPLQPNAFCFHSLSSETHYRVSTDVVTPLLTYSGFTTFPSAWTLPYRNLRVAFAGTVSRSFQEQVRVSQSCQSCQSCVSVSQSVVN